MKPGLLAAFLLLPAPAWAQPPNSANPAPVAPAEAPAEPRPAIWLLADADTRIYLFGSMHDLPRGFRWRSAAFDRIVRDAGELVLEVNPREVMQQQETAPRLAMQMSKSVPVLDRVSPDRRAGLMRALSEMDIPEGSLDRFETWGVALLLGAGRYMPLIRGDSARDLDPAFGVEAALLDDFLFSDRIVLGAESPTEMISGFRGMPLTEQRAMLDEAVDDYLAGGKVSESFEDRWVRGDLGGIAQAVGRLTPRLHDRMVARRNRNFTDWLVRRLERPGNILFVVGAGHLVERDSVLAMLESRGLRVQRIQ